MISSSYSGVGKTTAALAIANELARNGKKIFYFSLEHWVNEDIYSNTNASSEANFSHLYYLQQTNPQGIKKWLSNHSFLIKDCGCETLMPFLHPEDRLKLSSKESIEMLQSIMQSGLYHYVIVELEAGYDEFQLSMLEYANVHFIADYENVRLQNKSKQMIAYLKSQLDSEQQLSALEKAIYLKRSNHNRQEHVSLQKSDRASYTLPYIDQGLQAFQAPIYRAVIAKCLQDMRSVGELVS